jgi:ribosomal protein L21E
MKISNGTEVRLGKNRSVPIRYQGRTGIVVGKTQSNRGVQQLLVDFPGRRATPLAVNAKFALVL